MSTHRAWSALAVALALATASCSTGSQYNTPYSVSANQVTAEGSIIRVDKTNRMITIRGEDNEDFDVYASDNVRNFDQLQVGDRIAMDYTSAVAVELQPAGSADRDAVMDSAMGTAAPGDKPGGAAGATATVVTEVTAVDTRANTITLKGPRGNEVTLDVVRDDLRDRLKKVKVGDLLKVTLTEAIAVNVRPRPQ